MFLAYSRQIRLGRDQNCLKGVDLSPTLSRISTNVVRKDDHMSWVSVESIFKGAMSCRYCFSHGLATPAYLDLPQPRGIGLEYFSSRMKIAMVLLNPGRGDNDQHRKANERNRENLEAFKAGRMQLGEYLEAERCSMDDWGNPRGKFVSFVKSLGLSVDQIAIINLAWCADAKNKYPSKMLSECFKRHTSKLLGELAPDIVLLAGAKTQSYGGRIQKAMPNCEIVPTLHYAHRKGREAESHELKPLHDRFSRLR